MTTTKATKTPKTKAPKKAKAAAVIQAPAKQMAQLKFDDLSIGHFNVLSYLDNEFFSVEIGPQRLR